MFRLRKMRSRRPVGGKRSEIARIEHHMNTAARPKPLPWDQLKSRLDENQPFNMMRGTPYYRDAVYEQFSAQEYARRYAAIRAKLRKAKLDCVIVPNGP